LNEQTQARMDSQVILYYCIGQAIITLESS